MSVTHLAGPAVNIKGRVIQRCCICGEKLIDNLNSAYALNPDGTPPKIGLWRAGYLIHVDGNRETLGADFCHPITPLPDDFCLALVEE